MANSIASIIFLPWRTLSAQGTSVRYEIASLFSFDQEASQLL